MLKPVPIQIHQEGEKDWGRAETLKDVQHAYGAATSCRDVVLAVGDGV